MLADGWYILVILKPCCCRFAFHFRSSFFLFIFSLMTTLLKFKGGDFFSMNMVEVRDRLGSYSWLPGISWHGLFPCFIIFDCPQFVVVTYFSNESFSLCFFLIQVLRFSAFCQLILWVWKFIAKTLFFFGKMSFIG